MSKPIQTRRVADGVDVIVRDCELFDYLDDLFAEKGLHYSFIQEEVRDGETVYTVHFGENISEYEISSILNEVPQEEIDRIWKLNNG